MRALAARLRRQPFTVIDRKSGIVHPDDDDPSADAAWLAAQRTEVEAYLAAEGLDHGGVAVEPDWYEPEVLAVWRVRSGTAPNRLGWWAVSGDVPTDYVTATSDMDARSAVAAVAVRWQAAAARMAQGLPPEGMALGAREEWPTLAPMLRSRADTLAAWAADAELWA